MVASSNGNKKLVELLLKKNASLDLQSHINDACFFCVAWIGGMFDILDIGATALMIAANNNYVSIVKVLLEAKASVLVLGFIGFRIRE